MITLNNITKKYGDTTIFKNTNYKFKADTLTCFLGPSGSGKTTLLNLLAAFDTDYEGDIVMGDMNISKLEKDKLSEYRFSHIGFIFQHYNLLKGYTALENVLMSLNINNEIKQQEKIKKAKELLKEVGLEDKIDQKIETLSGGQKQRVAIARALVKNPKIILADEPTGALDAKTSEDIMKLLKDVSKSKTVIVITHDKEVTDYADEVIKLENNDIKVIKSGVEKYCKELLTFNKRGLTFSNSLKLSIKNFKIHLARLMIVALIIGFSASAFVSTIGAKNIMNQVINDFKDKNAYITNGFIPIYHEGNKVNENLEKIYEDLSSMDNLSDVYYQYPLRDIILEIDGEKIYIDKKLPTSLADVSLMNGNMPKDDEDEIVLSVNIASRISKDLQSLIGKNIIFTVKDKNGIEHEFNLRLSGISNENKENFILSQNVEKNIYELLELYNPTALTFNVEKFQDIISIHEDLTEEDIFIVSGYDEVLSLTTSFQSLLGIFKLLSYIVLTVGLFISMIVLYRISIERYREIGLYSALGYSRKQITSILTKETVLVSMVSASVSILGINVLDKFYEIQFGYSLNVSMTLLGLLIGLTIVISILMTNMINNRLINTEPAVALRK